MKKYSKNLSIIILTIIPISAVISCGESWKKWPTENGGKTTWNYESNIKQFDDNLYVKRSIVELKAAAWSNNNKEISLDNIHNQFELFYLLSDVLALKSNAKDIDDYWDIHEWNNFKTYLSNFNNEEISFLYKGDKLTVSFDFIESIKKINEGIDAALATIMQDGVLPDEDHKYKLTADDIAENGEPKNILSIATVGAPLLAISAVDELLKFDESFALRLSKLVNLPIASFDAFKLFMGDIDKSLDSLFGLSIFNNWVSEQGLNLKLNNFGQEQDDENIKGKFLVEALKRNS